MDPFDLFDAALSRVGLDPTKCYGPNHGAPLSTWAAFALVVVLAAGTLLGGVFLG